MSTFKILCPTDFSECSLNAIEYAAKLGEKYQAELILFHVPNTDDYQKLLSRDPKMYDLLNFAEKKIESLVKEVEKESIPKGLAAVTSEIKEGKTSSTILEYADEHKVDMIIMGTEGINDFKSNYIGTRTSKVVAKSDHDVFVVPRKVFFKKPRKFVYATDYMEEDKIAIQKVVELASFYDSEIDIVHVGTKKKQIDKALHQTMMAELEPFIRYEKVNYVLKSYRDEPGLGLENYLITAKGDVLVTLSKKKSWFDQLFTDNLSKKMSYFINKPLWVIKSV
ncbi:universal stress protein [Litoribacter ruber]|uniref:Universal stress protein n=1 Tax=Litoribacter ruber TaxID=702568 RepID=A0AAP2CH06_9BACT|nr:MULTISPECIES: universal stress protein [Litoribacter]MBS9524578.1 universal stress protein [Litoribacter alkaliphilus]MBT0810262.1 universal stress protein [Litoribacter ruber]